MRFIFSAILLLIVATSGYSQQNNTNNLNPNTNLNSINGASGNEAAFSQDVINQAVQAGYSTDQINSAITVKQSQQSSNTGMQPIMSTSGNKQRTIHRNDSIGKKSFLNLKRTDFEYNHEYDELEQLIRETEDKKRIKREQEEIKRRKNTVFGSDIFMTKSLSFASNNNIPTPKSYILGAGDEVMINVWGNSTMSHNQEITPDGYINIEEVGLIALSGLTINEAENRIKRYLSTIIEDVGIDTHINVSIGKMRSIMINVTGEVTRPGSFTLPSVATVMHALYLAGGTNSIGSLRNIYVYRNGEKIATLDVYDYILNGADSGNIILKDGDNISVPTYTNRVHAAGKLKREMIYELREDEPLSKLIEYAGGFSSEAYKDGVTLYRKSNSILEVLSVDKSLYKGLPLHDGDSLLVMGQTREYVNRLTIKGAVWREGDYQISESMNKLSQLIELAGGLRGDEFASRGVITRKNSDFTLSSTSFSVKDVVSGKSDVTLRNNDIVTIPAIKDMREERTVIIAGEVNLPDTILFAEGMTVEDLIVVGGGFKESASTFVEVSRRIKDSRADGYTSEIGKVFVLQVNEDLSYGENSFELEPFDQVHVRRSPAYSEQRNITVSGEAVFPGVYTITNDSTRLSDIIQRIGGLTPEAYSRGVSLRRTYTKEERATVINIRNLLASYTGVAKDSTNVNMLKIDTLSYSVGIDFEAAIRKPGGAEDIKLIAGDSIYIPKSTNTVKTAGGLFYPNAMTYQKKGVKKYINMSGGYKNGAKKKPFVIYMNGKVSSTKKFLFFASYPKVEPGCTIIVPLKSTSSKLTGIISAAGSITSLATTLALLVAGL